MLNPSPIVKLGYDSGRVDQAEAPAPADRKARIRRPKRRLRSRHHNTFQDIKIERRNATGDPAPGRKTGRGAYSGHRITAPA
jgi:hypothetical protein